MPIAPLPAGWGQGGAGLTDASLRPQLSEVLTSLITASNAAGGSTSRGRTALVAGTFTINTGIVLTANSRIQISLASRPSVTTNFAGIAVTARTLGAAGVAAFTVEAILATGAIDNDAVADVDWTIVEDV